MKRKIVACILLLAMLVLLLPVSIAQAATYRSNSKECVLNLQRNLTFLGFSTEGTDGYFGNNTRNAVKRLQDKLHMEVTGVMDDFSYTLLGDTVYDIQLYLKQKGFYVSEVDGIGGKGTINALKAYQKANGYAQTGVVEYSILKAMLQDATAKQNLGALEEYVARMEGTYVEKEYDEAYWDAYGTYAQQKMDELLERLGVREGTTVYFTRNQVSCTSSWVGGHGAKCKNCSVTHIMEDKDKWFQNEFGVIDTDNLPNHTFQKGTRGEKGQSCFGFANFVMWYIFQTPDSPDVRAEQVAPEGRFGKEYVQMYNVQPGDILRLDYGHSVVVYAVCENGIEIVDCNADTGNVSNCAIDKRFMKYNHGIYGGKPVCVDRVKYFDDSLLNTSEIYTSTDASVLTDERYQVVKTEEFVEYGYREKEFSIGTNSVKEGWILDGEATEGSVVVDWTEQVLIAGVGEEVLTRQTEKALEKEVYQYSNYYWYTTAGATNLSSRDWAEKYGRSYNKTVTKAWDYSGLSKSNYKYNVLYSKEYETPLEEITAPGGTPYVDETGFQWWQEDKKIIITMVPVTEYCKLVNTTTYRFYKWTEANGWRKDIPYEKSEVCEPVTRIVTLYHYVEK